ncbi:MAG: Flp family type IVb pilin [Devosia marina]|jgi:pilus assembly protein Flp/PilA|uniref:Flp family type IVb pilin n=1 Tax=Devosia marina TaxID=2683198 RepID=UPI000D5D579A
MSGPGRIDQRFGAVLHNLVADEAGATAIEYAMIASLLSVAVVGSALMLGGGLEDLWGFVRDEVMAGLAL